MALNRCSGVRKSISLLVSMFVSAIRSRLFRVTSILRSEFNFVNPLVKD